jgi:NADP-dependent 3-hydroxy acid dehydrogenase YdfG
MDLTNKVAIVTGCSKGIGLATVNALLEKGCKVAGWSRTSPDIKHSNFKFYATNVRDIHSVKAAFDLTTKDFGDSIHILINNAGIGFSSYLEEMPVEQWVKMFETNVNGVFYCSQLVIPKMKAMGEGSIINIASIAGKEGTPQLAGYCGTKFAVRGISQAMYKELRDYGIKVTCISPGSVQTEFFNNMEMYEVNENMMKPEDVAETIVYCLQTSVNYHPVELEVRPLMPKGRKVV